MPARPAGFVSFGLGCTPETISPRPSLSQRKQSKLARQPGCGYGPAAGRGAVGGRPVLVRTGGCMRVAALFVGLACLAGCTRAHYRLSADREVYPILGDRAAAAGFATDRLQLDPPPASRFADPTDPDHPPKPPDDPVAAVYMAHPNGMKGA